MAIGRDGTSHLMTAPLCQDKALHCSQDEERIDYCHLSFAPSISPRRRQSGILWMNATDPQSRRRQNQRSKSEKHRVRMPNLFRARETTDIDRRPPFPRSQSVVAIADF
jgi:hypothetical protein